MREALSRQRIGKHVEISGVVQGVGFRPFVRNLAGAHDLAGWVRNTSAGVEIEVAGPLEDLDAFVAELVSRAPPRAQIEQIAVRDIPTNGGDRFDILESQPRPDAYRAGLPGHRRV